MVRNIIIYMPLTTFERNSDFHKRYCINALFLADIIKGLLNVPY